MKGNYKLGIGLLIGVILVIALIQAAQKEPINWNKTYNPKDKIPFGTYVVRQEIKDVFKNNPKITAVNQSPYSYFNNNDSDQSKTEDFIFIGLEFNPGKTSLKSLLSFVEKGNNVFLAAKYLPKELCDTLKINFEVFDSYLAKRPFEKDSVYYLLAENKLTERFDRNSSQTFFNKLSDSATTILGYLKRGRIKLPNFIRVKFGKGYIFCQLTPDVYSNYFMLNPKTYPIAYQSLHHLNGQNILWYDGLYATEASQTPLRFILSRPALRAAWYLLLIALILFLIFRSKRKEKAIPIVKPEKNMSLAFAQTIGSLYYESGHPGNMVTKKINYFLYQLKKKYRFDDMALEKANFRKLAIWRFHMPEDEINEFFDRIVYYQKLANPTLTDLKTVQNIIEDFKQKIKL